jgi:hypothetical protein
MSGDRKLQFRDVDLGRSLFSFYQEAQEDLARSWSNSVYRNFFAGKQLRELPYVISNILQYSALFAPAAPSVLLPAPLL